MVFDSTAWLHVVLPCLAVILVSHWLGAIASYGSTLLALPFLALLLKDLPSAVLILALIGTFQAFQVCFHTYRDVDGPELRRMLGWAGCGFPLGLLAVSGLPHQPLFAVLGVVLIAAAVQDLILPSQRHGRRWPAPVRRALLVAAGAIHGAFGAGGATLVVYAQQAFTRKEAFRATLCAFWVILNPVLIAALLIRRPPRPAELGLIATALPLLFLVTWHANRVAGRLSQAAFRRLVAILLLVAGVVTAAKAWTL